MCYNHTNPMVKIFGVLNKRGSKPSPADALGRLASYLPASRVACKKFNVKNGCVGIALFEGAGLPQRIFSDPQKGFLLLAGTPVASSGGLQTKPAECLWRLYKKQGSGFLKELKGIFSLVLWDPGKELLLVANDKLGLFPVYGHNGDDQCFFCTDAEPLMKTQGLQRTLDFAAAGEFFHLGYPLAGKTFVREIANLAPGTMLGLQKGLFFQKCYFEFCVSPKPLKTKILLDNLSSCFEEALRQRTKGGEACFTELTGGWDTRFIAGNLHRLGKKINAVTYFYDNTDKKDVLLATEVAKKFGFRHFIISYKNRKDYNLGRRLTPEIEPWFSDRNLGREAIVAPAASKAGMLKDFLRMPVFSGHGSEMLNRNVDFYDLQGGSFDPGELFSKDFLGNIGQTSQETLRKEEQRLRQRLPWHKNFSLYLFHVCRAYMNTEGAGWTRPACQFHNSTYHHPFLDIDFLQWVFCLPPQAHDRRLYYELYRSLCPEFLKVPFLMRPATVRRSRLRKSQPLRYWASHDEKSEWIRHLIIKTQALRILSKLKGGSRGRYADAGRAAREFPERFILFEKWYSSYEGYLDKR